MIRLYLEYSQRSSGGEPLEGEHGQFALLSDTNIEVTFKRLYREKPQDKFFMDSYEVPDHLATLDKLWLAVIRYQSGGSFGTSHGNWHGIGLFESKAMAEEATQNAIESESEEYKPWEGFFERLEYSETICLQVT